MIEDAISFEDAEGLFRYLGVSALEAENSAIAIAAQPEPKLTGIVEMYDSVRGFGFIRPDDGSGDIFVHAARLQTGLARLMKLDRVAYRVIAGAKGREQQADAVELIR